MRDPLPNPDEMICPECKAKLKKRRTANPAPCEMVCGGCGRIFDVCMTDRPDADNAGQTP